MNEDDLAKADPARALLDNAKDLKLTDREKQALDTVVKRYEWNTRLFAKGVDSLRTAMRAHEAGRRTAAVVGDGADAGGEPSTARALVQALQSIRNEFTADSSASLQKLDDVHRKAAEPMLGAARAKLDEVLSAAMTSRGSGGRA